MLVACRQRAGLGRCPRPPLLTSTTQPSLLLRQRLVPTTTSTTCRSSQLWWQKALLLPAPRIKRRTPHTNLPPGKHPQPPSCEGCHCPCSLLLVLQRHNRCRRGCCGSLVMAILRAHLPAVHTCLLAGLESLTWPNRHGASKRAC